jgi:hypothetical protein
VPHPDSKQLMRSQAVMARAAVLGLVAVLALLAAVCLLVQQAWGSLAASVCGMNHGGLRCCACKSAIQIAS